MVANWSFRRFAAGAIVGYLLAAILAGYFRPEIEDYADATTGSLLFVAMVCLTALVGILFARTSRSTPHRTIQPAAAR